MPLAGWLIKGQRVSFAEAYATARREGHFYRFPPAAWLALARQQRRLDRLRLSPSAAGGCARRTILELTEDYWADPESLWAPFVGTAVHQRLETGEDHAELLLSLPLRLQVGDTEVEIPLTGTLDHYDPEYRRLTDYKTTSREFRFYDKRRRTYVERELPDPEHVVQTNLYRLLLEEHGYPVESIQIWYVRVVAGAARKVVSVPLWDREDAYYTALELAQPLAEAAVTGVLPPCTCRWPSKTDPDLCHTDIPWDATKLAGMVTIRQRKGGDYAAPRDSGAIRCHRGGPAHPAAGRAA